LKHIFNWLPWHHTCPIFFLTYWLISLQLIYCFFLIPQPLNVGESPNSDFRPLPLYLYSLP
jgi:hypothetical protein